jgi:hypothetical protein
MVSKGVRPRCVNCSTLGLPCVMSEAGRIIREVRTAKGQTRNGRARVCQDFEA